MNKETNDFLLENLQEAHYTFLHILKEMKENNIEADYYELEQEEMNCYHNVSTMLNKMCYFVNEEAMLREEFKDMYEYEHSLYIKYISLYAVSFALIKLFHIIFDTSELNDMIKYLVGMLLSGTYIGLLNNDINQNRSDTKEKRDANNRIKTMKEDYKEMHDKVVCEIDGIFNLNSILWDKIEKDKVKVM